MEAKYCLYELKRENDPHHVRKGALLRIKFKGGGIGYADCHPWKELGDLPLTAQLAAIKAGQKTVLTERSIQFAKLDAEARLKGISLFQGLKVPDSHDLIPNLKHSDCISERFAEGFKIFKIKLGSALQVETKALISCLEKHPYIRVRLDFNLKLTFASFQHVLSSLSIYRHQIDYIEDPFHFSIAEWKHFQTVPLTLACDHRSLQAVSLPEAAKVLVIKPAVQSWHDFQNSKNQRLVFTSYLDHPLGQAAAAYTAAIAAKQFTHVDVCGLLSHRVYQENSFSAHLAQQGPAFLPPSGTGFGFDELLESQPWSFLCET